MPNTTDPPLTGWEPEVKMIAIPLYSITMFLSLVGNILVIYVLYKRPETRRLTSFMYVNLAVADLLVTTVVMPAGDLNSHTNGRKMDKWTNWRTATQVRNIYVFCFDYGVSLLVKRHCI